MLRNSMELMAECRKLIADCASELQVRVERVDDIDTMKEAVQILQEAEERLESWKQDS